MNFELTKTEQLFRQMIREFAENEVKPLAAEIDEEERFPVETVEKMAKLGIFGIPFPVNYGGAGGNNILYSMAVEELSRVCATTGVVVSAHTSLCAAPIYEHGTEEQKMKYLPKLCSGEWLGAFGLTEPNAGTDAAAQQTTAVDAGDHYILNYAVGAGDGGIDITVDPSYKIYEYTFEIPSEPSTQLAEPTVNAWAKRAYVSSSVISTVSELQPELMTFQYRVKGTNDWSKVAATHADEDNYKATLIDLQPATNYECRMVYGEEEFTSTTKEFTTEAATELYNGSFDNWSQSGETIYPDIEANAGNTTSFWNTSNPGTSQGLGAIGGAVNPTTSVDSPVVNGKAARLQSTSKLSVFAAASLYTGNFAGLNGMSANMEFGKPFTGRPIALHGYYQYTPAVINHVDRVPAGVQITEDVTMDQCAIYIALAKKSFSFNNNDESSYIDYANDEDIIAYGELPSGGATSDTGENNGYTEFTIPLVYRSLTDTPTHIIVVCSASKYGDYMTGGEGSTLLVDEFSLVYDGEPTVKEQAQE